MENKAKLCIVATPIGNLADFSLRGIKTLQTVDYILCEDTRVTKKLLNHHGIETATISYHQHSSEKKVREIKKLLAEGKNLALVTDAGTPGISDPGNMLIAQLIDVEIVPIPGASAVITALSISGFPTDKFLFLGFPPHKKGRNKYFAEVKASKYTVAFYESSHRISKTLSQLAEVLDKKRKICICRELTKKFESIYRGSVGGLEEMSVPAKGEFVVVINNK